MKCSAANKARAMVTDAVNEAVKEEIEKNEEAFLSIENVDRKSDGTVSAIFSNTRKMNDLKSRINLVAQAKIASYRQKKIRIPIGTLIGTELLFGRGIMVPFSIYLSGDMNMEFKSVFSAAGINQTRHQVYLEVQSNVTALVPGCASSTEIKTEIPLSETLIVGSVPNAYSAAGSLGLH